MVKIADKSNTQNMLSKKPSRCKIFWDVAQFEIWLAEAMVNCIDKYKSR